MVNLMSFLSAFASYLLVFVIFLAVAFIGINIGIKLRKNKDAKAPESAKTEA